MGYRHTIISIALYKTLSVPLQHRYSVIQNASDTGFVFVMLAQALYCAKVR